MGGRAVSGGRTGSDPRLDAPAFHRNVGPLTEALRARLAGRSGPVLEIGAGTGQHAAAFARAPTAAPSATIT